MNENRLLERWEDLTGVRGYYAGEHSDILAHPLSTTSGSNKNIFATGKQAKASIALAQLTQLLKAWQDEWNPDWLNGELKYSIIPLKTSRLDTYSMKHSAELLCFPTSELRSKFFEAHEELIKQAAPLLWGVEIG